MLDWMIETRNLENPDKPLDLSEEANWSASGESVNENTAGKLAAVYSCIGVLGRSLGQLPLHVLRKVDGKVTRATDHPVYYLLHDEPNSMQTSYDWRETIMVHVNGWGNGYSPIERDRHGTVVGLDLLRPWESSLFRSSSNRWVYSVSSDELPLKSVNPDDMLHFKAIGSNGLIGRSPILQCAETFALGQASQRYGNRFFGGGGRPAAIVSAKGQLNKESWNILKTAWKQAKRALRDEDNNTLMLPAELDYNQLTIAPEDAQFLETRKFNRSEIAGIYNVPSHMINDLDKATFSNISEQAIQFVRHTMIPWVVKFEQEMNRKLFTQAERRAGYYVKFNLNGLLRGTSKDRAEFYTKAIRDGWMTRNEVRELEEMNQADGLDKFLMSADLQPKVVGDKNEKR
ncbi:portal protein [Paraferrimonas haliotis]|uniref:Portal protein n=2 Tax=Paraferrimonas haliotis TaxID=2013866 RepID=A0AA37TUT8_9GAMM|nr:portal protein [Paraferrimonas haliotis]